MAVSVSWYDDNQHILHYIFTGKWTWDEYFVALTQGRGMMTSVDHYVCVVNDMTGTTHLPDDFMTKARMVTGSRPLNTGRAVFASNDTFFIKVHTTLAQLSPDWARNYLREESLDAAIANLRKWLAEHPELPGER